MKRFSYQWPLLLIITVMLFASCTQQKATEPSKKVILIGIDGMSTDGFQIAKTPTLDSLVRKGVLSLKTRGVMPTVSGPSWGSILHGAGPEQHGITTNAWTTENRTILPTVADDQGYFPSVFTVLREQFPNVKQAMAYDWESLANLVNHNYIDSLILASDYHSLGVVDLASNYILNDNPDFVFLYIGYPDEVGHASGYNSPEYHESLEQVDAKLGSFFHGLKSSAFTEELVVLVVTDHGGIGRGHGGESMIEIQIPWMISGSGIRENVMLEQPNDLYNTASTIINLFGGVQPECWVGMPAFGAYEAFSADYPENNNKYLAYPEFSIPSAYYFDPIMLNIDGIGVRYTLDGREPDSLSLSYTGAIRIDQNVTVKAKSFDNGSMSATNTLRIHMLNRYESLLLEHQADNKYKAKGVASLLDQEWATASYGDENWLGFQEKNLVLYVELKDKETISNVSCSFLKNEASWIFAPKSISVYSSKDGRKYERLAMKILNRETQPTGKTMQQITFSPVRTKYVKVVVEKYGRIPKPHRGAGDQAWLFVDEIELD